MSLEAGARIGPYDILSLLGAGGMGEVYRARDPRLEREVALKVLPASVASDPDRLRRFELEAKAAGALNHPSILAVFDVGAHDGRPYVVAELLDGETLRARLGGGPLPLRKALDYAVQIARGLAAAHDKGIAHRDLKPENLFVTRDGRVKILDFGLAKLVRAEGAQASSQELTVSQDDSGTSPGMLLGTAGYMSPEQVRGLPADARADIFAFGAILYEMAWGERAFPGETTADRLYAILHNEPAGLAGDHPLPPGLQRIVRHCLEKSPGERFQSARDLAFDLEALSEVSGVGFARGGARRSLRRRLGVTAAAGLAAVAALAGFLGGRRASGPAEPPTFQEMTFRRGTVWSAQFAPDGDTIVYSATWQGKPMEVFSTRRGSTESRPLGLSDARVLSISSSGEMALLLRPRLSAWHLHTGTLARAPLAGGAPREILEDVQDADWAPNGTDLAVVRWVEGASRLEFPVGKVLYQPAAPAWISDARVSPRGDRIAFFEHPVAHDDRGSVAVLDLAGGKRTLADGFANETGLRWSRKGDEVWLSGSRARGPDEFFVVTSSGKERVAVRFPGPVLLLDVGRNGSLLLQRVTTWTETWGHGPGEARDRDLSVRYFSFVDDLSADGTTLAGTDLGKASGSSNTVYITNTSGGPSVDIGLGEAQAISPDRKWVLTLRPGAQKLVSLPTGAGEERWLEAGGISHYVHARWFPDGKRIVFEGAEPGHGPRLYVQDLSAGPPRPLTPEGVSLPPLGSVVSPDGRLIVALAADLSPVLYSVGGGEPSPVRGLEAGDLPIGWTADGHGLFFVRIEELDFAARVYHVGVSTGRSAIWKEIVGAAPIGMIGQYRILISPDGNSYVYNFTRHMGDLYLVDGVR